MQLTMQNVFGSLGAVGVLFTCQAVYKLRDPKRHYATPSQYEHLLNLHSELRLLTILSKEAQMSESSVSMAWRGLVTGLSRVGLDRFVPSSSVLELKETVALKEQEIAKTTRYLDRVCTKTAINHVLRGIIFSIFCLWTKIHNDHLKSKLDQSIELIEKNRREWMEGCANIQKQCNQFLFPKAPVLEFAWKNSTTSQKVGYLAKLVDLLKEKAPGFMEGTKLVSHSIRFCQKFSNLSMSDCDLSQERVFEYYLRPVISSTYQYESLLKEMAAYPVLQAISNQSQNIQGFLRMYCPVPSWSCRG